MRDYFLQGRIGRRSRVSITPEKFRELQRATETLSHFLKITQTYRVVLESYRAVEQAKHDAELNYILHTKAPYRSSLESTVVLNSAIVGYLASARLFLDSTEKLIKILLDEESIAAFNHIRTGMYDGSVEYRFIEALRNYVQHRDLPVHLLTYRSFVEDQSDIRECDLVTCLSIRANREALRKDSGFKRSALEGLPDVIDIIDCIRFHMEGMWQLHNHLVTEHASLASAARAQIAATIQQFAEETKDNPVGLEATAGDPESPSRERVPLLLDWDDARIVAVGELGDLTNLHKRYITGKIQRA